MTKIFFAAKKNFHLVLLKYTIFKEITLQSENVNKKITKDSSPVCI